MILMLDLGILDPAHPLHPPQTILARDFVILNPAQENHVRRAFTFAMSHIAFSTAMFNLHDPQSLKAGLGPSPQFPRREIRARIPHAD